MNTTPVDPPEERLELVDVALALLSFAAGAMDALAFFSLGEVFPSAMTGNTALLGLAIGQGHLTRASRPFVAFVGFLAGGALASASLELRLKAVTKPQAVWRLLALEACLLAVFTVAWTLVERPIADLVDYPIIVVASSAMGIQSVAARLLGAPGDHDRRLHQHADVDRSHDDPGLAAAAAPSATRRLPTDRDVL